MSSLQRYRSQTMKDYGLMIEYKHLRQHVPGGIYVLPSFDESRIWYGTIFIHTGLYRNGIFKFTIYLPDKYVSTHLLLLVSVYGTRCVVSFPSAF